MQASKMRSPSRDPFFDKTPERGGPHPFLSRSASSTPATSKYGFRGTELPGNEDLQGKKLTMLLTRGSSFRRQGSSGMTWADNWIFTDDGMFLGRHGKVSNSNEKSGTSPGPLKAGLNGSTKGSFPTELQRSQSVGSVGSRSTSRKEHGRTHEHGRSHHRSGGFLSFKWIKRSFRKAFR